jgi:hypothetical protein
MKEAFAYIAWVAAVLVVMAGAAFAIQGADFALYRYFAPRQEAVRRRVFEESKAYNQSAIQELRNMEFEYHRTDAAHRAALASIILHRAADYDSHRLPPDLQHFISTLRSEGDIK